MTRVAGLSGTRTPAGWVLVQLEDRALGAIRLQPDLGSALATADEAGVVAVDLPVGHDDPKGGVRACDERAREFVGPRSGSVPKIPPPEVLEAHDLAAARDLAEARGWPVPDEALFALRERILAVNRADDDRLVEVHPEVSYVAIRDAIDDPGYLEHPPGDRRGRHERLELLYEVDLRPARSMGGVGRASPMDVLEATAAAWSAHRVAAGDAGTLPADPPPDPETGRPVAIRY